LLQLAVVRPYQETKQEVYSASCWSLPRSALLLLLVFCFVLFLSAPRLVRFMCVADVALQQMASSFHHRSPHSHAGHTRH
jgi:hypothetical protein